MAYRIGVATAWNVLKAKNASRKTGLERLKDELNMPDFIAEELSDEIHTFFSQDTNDLGCTQDAMSFAFNAACWVSTHMLNFSERYTFYKQLQQVLDREVYNRGVLKLGSSLEKLLTSEDRTVGERFNLGNMILFRPRIDLKRSYGDSLMHEHASQLSPDYDSPLYATDFANKLVESGCVGSASSNVDERVVPIDGSSGRFTYDGDEYSSVYDTDLELAFQPVNNMVNTDTEVDRIYGRVMFKSILTDGTYKTLSVYTGVRDPALCARRNASIIIRACANHVPDFTGPLPEVTSVDIDGDFVDMDANPDTHPFLSLLPACPKAVLPNKRGVLLFPTQEATTIRDPFSIQTSTALELVYNSTRTCFIMTQRQMLYLLRLFCSYPPPDMIIDNEAIYVPVGGNERYRNFKRNPLNSGSNAATRPPARRLHDRRQLHDWRRPLRVAYDDPAIEKALAVRAAFIDECDKIITHWKPGRDTGASPDPCVVVPGVDPDVCRAFMDTHKARRTLA